MAQVEHERAAAKRLQNGLDAFLQGAPAGNQPERIEIALHGSVLLVGAGGVERHGPVQSKRGHARFPAIAPVKRACAFGKADNRNVRIFRSHLFDNTFDRRHAESFETRFVQHTGPAVENLHGVDAGFDLPNQVGGRLVRQKVEQGAECLRFTIGKEPCRCLVGRAMAISLTIRQCLAGFSFLSSANFRTAPDR